MVKAFEERTTVHRTARHHFETGSGGVLFDAELDGAAGDAPAPGSGPRVGTHAGYAGDPQLHPRLVTPDRSL